MGGVTEKHGKAVLHFISNYGLLLDVIRSSKTTFGKLN